MKQGKKVCKVTAVRCAYLLLFAGIAEKRYSQMVTTTTTPSYIGELLTAPDRCKKQSSEVISKIWTKSLDFSVIMSSSYMHCGPVVVVGFLDNVLIT